MPADPFTNARPYYDVAFPSSGDSFSISGFKNAFQGLGFLDFIPGQPRAHGSGDMGIMVRGRDASAFYNPVYAGDADRHLFIGSGDSALMVAPVSNPRIDIVYWTASGDIRIVTGTEAVTPTLPSLSPSGDTRIPICAVYHKVAATKIVNFEDKDSNTGDSYIYQDLRPFLRAAGLGGTTLSSTAALSSTGDNAAGTATAASRQDHTHQGIHTMHAPGSGDMFGDVEIYGPPVRQEGRRISIGGLVGFSYQIVQNRVVGATTTPYDNTPPLNTEGDEYLFVIHKPRAIGNLCKVGVSMNVCEAANNANNCTVALYADGTLLKAVHDIVAIAADIEPMPVTFTHVVSIASMNAIRFSVRAGFNASAADLIVNGNAAGGLYGGSALSSILTVEEMAP